jgi:hypothetical protein
MHRLKVVDCADNVKKTIGWTFAPRIVSVRCRARACIAGWIVISQRLENSSTCRTRLD